MTLALIVWLVMSVFPALKAMAVIGTVTVGVLTVCHLTINACTEGDYWDKTKGMLRPLKWAVPLLLLLHMVPDEKTSWYMVGAYGTQKLVESPVAQELASDGVDVMKSLLARAKAEIEDKPEVKK